MHNFLMGKKKLKLHWSSVMISGHVPPDLPSGRFLWLIDYGMFVQWQCPPDCVLFCHARCGSSAISSNFIAKFRGSFFFPRGRQLSPQSLILAMMDWKTGVWSCSAENCRRQPVETWTSCHLEAGCKATKLADKISFLMASNSTVKLGHCSSLGVQRTFKSKFHMWCCRKSE